MTQIVVTPAPSGGGVLLRDPFTRVEIFVDTENLLPLARRLQSERDRLTDSRRQA